MSGHAGMATSPTSESSTSQTKSVVVENRSTAGASRNPETIRRRLIAVDALVVITGIMLAFVVQWIWRPVPTSITARQLTLAACSLPAFAVGAATNHLYLARANDRPSNEVKNILRATTVGVVGLVALAFLLQFKELSRLWVIAIGVSVAALWITERAIARRIFAHMRSDGRLCRRIVIVGTDAHAIGLYHTYDRNPTLGYDVVGFVGPDTLAARGEVPVLGDLADLPGVLEEREAVGVVISLASVNAEDVNVITRKLTDDRYHVALSSTLEDIDVTRLRPQQLDGRTMIYVEPTIHGGWRSIAKRAYDVVGAFTILLLTAPIMLASAIAIRTTSRGGVLFRQTRVGKDGEHFQLVKFRTMAENAEDSKHELVEQNEMDGPLFKIENDPRVTPVGRFLRKMSIDELPQLWCVLKGTMSLVGPRPALPDEVEQWDVDVRERLRVLPGLTGMWQVSGRSETSFEHYKRMDLYYVHNWSLAHDVRICTKTVKVVLSGRGAS